MAETMSGLFGPSPYEVEQQRRTQMNTDASNFANMNATQRGVMGMFKGAGMLAGAGAEAVGMVDPAVENARSLQQAAQGADTSTPEGLMQYADKIRHFAPAKAAQAVVMAREMKAKQEAAMLASRKEDRAQQKLEEVDKQRMENDFELRKQQLSQAYDIAKMRSEDSRLNSADRLAASREATAARVQMAQLMAEMKRMGLEARISATSDKVTAKAQEKADKAEEGRESLEGDITKARSLLTKLGASGGITSTQKGALANLLTSMSTTGVGQGLGRMVGSQDQSSRDELKSIRLQLLNSIKQATGMGSAQLNSNVELQTWLNSLGSEGMSKETNEEILTNIENKYLKKKSAAPQGLPANAKIIGKTPAGKDVYETPDGKRWVP